MNNVVALSTASALAIALSVLSPSAGAQIGGIDSGAGADNGSTPADTAADVGVGATSTSSLTAPSSLLGPVDLGTNPPFSSFGRFLPGVGANASGTTPSARLPSSALDSTTSTLGAPSSLLGPIDLGTNPPFSSFGRFLPGVGPNASGTRPSPRLRTPGTATGAASSSGGGVFSDSFCDPQDFTCDE